MEANMFKLLFLLCLQLSVAFALDSNQIPGLKKQKESKQAWGYVNIRQDAFMFWWLYYCSGNGSYLDRPLVMWLQGGPGASSTGFGNFGEIGPLDGSLAPRNTTWVKHVNVLFIDNPVGTGFSYVTNTSALVTNNSQVASDLVVLFKAFLLKLPEFQKIPFYIFSESYGGKMAIEFGSALYKITSSGKLPCNFKGITLGDSWISPIDSVTTWGPYLYSTSMVDENGLEAIKTSAEQTKHAIDEGSYANATMLFSATEDVVAHVTNGVNFYNILAKSQDSALKNLPKFESEEIRKLYLRHVGCCQELPLSELMNGPIREKLHIIPANVTWGGQSGDVFTALADDFMKPVTSIVDNVLNTTNISVTIYNGQLDLIVDTPGTLAWVNNLKWAGRTAFQKASRTPISIGNNQRVAYLKEFKNLAFYWVLNAGHMVPADAGEASVKLLHMITGMQGDRKQYRKARNKTSIISS